MKKRLPTHHAKNILLYTDRKARPVYSISNQALMVHQHNRAAKIDAKMRRAAQFIVANHNYAHNEYNGMAHHYRLQLGVLLIKQDIEDNVSSGASNQTYAIY